MAARFLMRFLLLACEPTHCCVVFLGIFPLPPWGTITAAPLPIIRVPAMGRRTIRLGPTTPFPIIRVPAIGGSAIRLRPTTVFPIKVPVIGTTIRFRPSRPMPMVPIAIIGIGRQRYPQQGHERQSRCESRLQIECFHKHLLSRRQTHKDDASCISSISLAELREG